ncbi:MAG TPA: RNA polymerase sporulation sigma factor SigK [Clostridiales bacterium]|nr:RNA polymerase sporulation sigma factor SigK [Clostridiales bacterium]
MKSFPQPLSANDERDCLIKCKEGDEEARGTLIVHNLRLVAHIVKKYSLVDKETDDLISIGTIGLIKAIDTFDNSKKVRLATYASRCIENELLMMLRSNKKISKEVYLYDPIGADKEGNEINLLDIIEEKENNVIDDLILDENVEKLYKIIGEALTDREKEIISLRYGLNNKNEVTQREIAGNLEISRSYVSRIEKKALKKLREYFE